MASVDSAPLADSEVYAAIALETGLRLPEFGLGVEYSRYHVRDRTESVRLVVYSDCTLGVMVFHYEQGCEGDLDYTHSFKAERPTTDTRLDLLDPSSLGNHKLKWLLRSTGYWRSYLGLPRVKKRRG